LPDSVEEPKQEEPPIIPRLCMSPLERASKVVQEQIWNEILAFSLFVDPGILEAPGLRQTQMLDGRVGLLLICKMLSVSYDSWFL
jgi:hypothetical protein